MKINGDEKLSSVFQGKVEGLFGDTRFAAADVWYISEVDTLNLFYSWYNAQGFTPKNVNDVIVVTNMDYSDFNSQVREGLTYVLKIDAEDQPEPISMSNLLNGWSMLYAPILNEIVAGSDNSKNIEILVNQSIFSILDINNFLTNIPGVRDAIISFVSSQKTELEQKVEDLNEAVSAGALTLNEDVTSMLQEKDGQIAELSEKIGQLEQIATNLIGEKETLEAKLSEGSDSEALQVEVEELKKSLAEKEQELVDIQQKLASTSEQTGEVEEIRASLTVKEEELNAVKSSLAEKEQELQELKTSLEEKDAKISEMESSDNSAEVAQLETKVRDLEVIRDSLTEEKEELKKAQADLESECNLLKTTKEDLAKHNAEVQRINDDLTAKLQEMENSEGAQNEEQLQELQSLRDEKVSLENKLKATEEKAQALEATKDKLTEERDNLVNTLKSENEDLEKANTDLSTKVKEIQEELEKAKAESGSSEEAEMLKQEIEKLKQQISSKDELLSKVDGDHNTNELLNKISKQSKKLADCQAIISEMKDTDKSKSRMQGINIVSTVFGKEEDAASLKREIEKLTSELESKNLKIQELTAGNDVTEVLEAENTELKAQLTAANERIAELTAKIGEVEI